MNNKILIGSIIAVVILVLVSFTGVVGYSSVKSSSAINSPLFNVRSNRAIDEESKGIVCDYVGKENENIIVIPKRNKDTPAVQKGIDIISKMDYKTFNRFLELIISHRQNDGKLLEQLKNDPMKLMNHRIIQETDSDNRLASGSWTWCDTFVCGNCVSYENIGCLLSLTIYILAMIYNKIGEIILEALPSIFYTGCPE